MSKSVTSAPTMIELAHRLRPIVRAAQPPIGHEVDYTESYIRLEKLLRETVEQMYPGAAVLTTERHSKTEEWLNVSIEWRCRGVSQATLDTMPAHADIHQMMTDIVAACQQVCADEARWLVTSPYARETCGECGENIEPTERYVPICFFSAGWNTTHGAVHEVFIHERCRERVFAHFVTDMRMAKVDQQRAEDK